jgi:hypothetical protein
MQRSIKTMMLITMTAALFFGFLHLFVPGTDFERLHIFLFNLCSGGTLLLVYTEQKRTFSAWTGAFFLLSVGYALSAFFGIYPLAIAIALALAVIVESIRIRAFSFFPADFFKRSTATSAKFHQAALLCLSMGLVISSLVIINHEYVPLVASNKLILNVFFLGFSFPVSLITMSLMFGMMENHDGRTVAALKEYSFWAVNLGVIVFFLFILAGILLAEFLVALVLFFTVLLIFGLYLKTGARRQPRGFLTSGALFLIMTAVTGIAYIMLYYFIPEPPGGKLLLKLHALISLYGWNLNGIVVICRHCDFPIRLNSVRLIMFHWVIVALIAPLGFYFRIFSIVAVAAYAVFLYLVLFSKASSPRKIPAVS